MLCIYARPRGSSTKNDSSSTKNDTNIVDVRLQDLLSSAIRLGGGGGGGGEGDVCMIR